MVVVRQRRGQARGDGPRAVHREYLPERRYPLCVLDLVQWGAQRHGRLERGGRIMVAAAAAVALEVLELLLGRDLVEAEPDGEPRGDRGVVVALEGAAVPEEVAGEEARGLQDVDDAV